LHSPAIRDAHPTTWTGLAWWFPHQDRRREVYLLRGGGGDLRDWTNYTDVSRFAERGIALVMPQGDHSYYVNAADPPDVEGRAGSALEAVGPGARDRGRVDGWFRGDQDRLEPSGSRRR